jgi:uncharacterized protein (TIGR03067 family)
MGVPEPTPNDWLPLLDAALAKLPDRDRDPIVLCDLQGRSRADAATELGIPEGTLSSRLARSREKLRIRLARLGAVLSLPVMTSGLAEQATATVSASLIESTIAAGTTAAAAKELADGVIRTMIFAKATKLIAAGVCVMGTLTAGVMWMPTAGADPVPKGKETPKQPAAKDVAKPDGDHARIQGTWVVETTSRSKELGKGTGGVGGAGGGGFRGGSGGPGGFGGQFGNWDGMAMTFVGDQVDFRPFAGRTQRFKLDPKAEPKRIDFTIRDLDDFRSLQAVRPSIYRFEGEKLRIVLGDEDLEARPDSFEMPEKDSPFVNMLLRRPSDDERKTLERTAQNMLEGTWWAVIATIRGELQSLERGEKIMKLVFKGDRLRFDSPTGPLHATFVLNLGTAPWQIDLTTTADWGEAKKGSKVVGIIARTGDRRTADRIMLSLGTAERPVNFDVAAKEGTVYTFVREGISPNTYLDLIPPKPPKAAPATNKRLRELQEERVKALEEQIGGQFERVKIGKDPLTTLLDAVWELGQAKLEIASTHEAKLAAMDETVKHYAVIEEQLQALREAGLQAKEAVAQSRAARLKAEIALEKLKAAK